MLSCIMIARFFTLSMTRFINLLIVNLRQYGWHGVLRHWNWNCLLLWTDPRPLPRIGEVQAAWDYYIRNWRPGKPHPKSWAPLYAQAMEDVQHAE